MNKNIAAKQTAAVMQTPEQYEGFEVSVLAAAHEQAGRIVTQATRDSEDAFNAAVSRIKGDPVAARKTQNEAALRRRIAGAQQENLRRLLIYRKQLVNGLFAEAGELLLEHTETSAYLVFLQNTLQQYAEKAETAVGETREILLRKTDLKHQKTLSVLLPGADFIPDPSIRLGGLKLVLGRVVYDETLDERLRAQRTAFLSHCNLHVQTPLEEEAQA